VNRLTRRLRDTGDAGFSLAEVLVSMAVMSVVMAIASSGFYDMFHTSDTAETSAAAQAELQASFNKLDREVRYASRVSPGYADTTTWYIDYVFVDDAGSNQCVQLSLPKAGGTLKRRQYPFQGGVPTGTGTAVANNLISARLDNSTPRQMINPFLQEPAGEGGSEMDRLNFKVNSIVGQDTTKQGVREYDLQFTAINTLGRALAPLVCAH
jgi:prepilin-type N-terminal cleavage/methylation domain-containing protein